MHLKQHLLFLDETHGASRACDALPHRSPHHRKSCYLTHYCTTVNSVTSHALLHHREFCYLTRIAAPHPLALQLQFHDAGRANAMGLGRVPLFTDFYGLSMGALGEKGALYASPASKDSPSVLVYR